LGAFDYLQKPCTIEEIVSCANRALAEKEELDRQRQLARWAESKPALELSATVPAKSTIRSGELVIELGSHMVSVGGERLLLTPTEYELLKIMAKALGQPIMVERLVQEGLGYNPKDPQALETLRVHISRLRRKVGSDYILTIRGGGYALAYIPVT
jgi:DNA-binding response OmpR family regulator